MNFLSCKGHISLSHFCAFRAIVMIYVESLVSGVSNFICEDLRCKQPSSFVNTCKVQWLFLTFYTFKFTDELAAGPTPLIKTMCILISWTVFSICQSAFYLFKSIISVNLQMNIAILKYNLKTQLVLCPYSYVPGTSRNEH